MAADTIHLQSQHKGIRVAVTGGEMADSPVFGRPPSVKVKPAVLQFERGFATVERDSREGGAFWRHAGWKDLGAKTRGEAVEAIKRLAGHSIDFAITDPVVETGLREPVAAAKQATALQTP